MNPEETKSSYYEQFISRPYALFFLVSGLLVLIVLAVLFARVLVRRVLLTL